MSRFVRLLCATCLISCARTQEREPSVEDTTSADEAFAHEEVVHAVDQAASKLEDIAQRLQRTSATFVEVSTHDFAQRDLAWYDATRTALKARRFVALRDIADVDVNRLHPENATFMRLMLSGDGKTMASFFHYGDGSAAIRVVDFETELSDGRFVSTANSAQISAMDYGTIMHTTAVETHDAGALYAAHLQHLMDHLRTSAGVTVRELRTYEAFMASQARMQLLKGLYRQAREIPFTKEELTHITRGRHAEAVSLVAEELRLRFPTD